MAFNYLSGSSIDNITSFLFDALNSGDCYLGFGRGTSKNQWGINTLINISHKEVNGSSYFPNVDTAINGDNSVANKFFDLNSMKYIAANDSNRTVYIEKYANSDINFTTPLPLGGNPGNDLKMTYLGKDWALIQGLNPNFYTFMTPSSTASYYIFNYQSNKLLPIKINTKLFSNIPYFTTNCKLFMSPNGSGTPVLVKDSIQRTTNILGETYVSGFRDLIDIQESDIDAIFNEGVSADDKKTLLLNSTFTLYDDVGNILIDNLLLDDPNPGNTQQIYSEVTGYSYAQKYLTFKYLYINDDYQYIKFTIGAKQVNELAIWPEALPYTSIVPVADANPPALDVSYLKSAGIHNSIFDVNGLIRINPATSGEVMFVKELNNNAEIADFTNKGFQIENLILNGEQIKHTGIVKTSVSASTSTNIIELQDFHTFVVGDQLFIPFEPNIFSANPPGILYTLIDVDRTSGSSSITLNQNIVLNDTLYADTLLNSEYTNVSSKIVLAKTNDIDKALNNGLYNVMISKTVDLTGVNSPTEGLYRQLFIAYKPKTTLGVQCTADIYNGDNLVTSANFNPTTWTYNNGIILYLSNKIPIYRKWASANEEFKIIL